jgi:hypothetical protein
MAYLVRTGSVLTEQGMVAPSAFLGLELHFLDMLSLELDPAKLRLLNDTREYTIVLSPSALLKWVFKPSDFMMIEPYAVAESAMAVTGREVPWLSVFGGVQLGLRGGERGAVVFDFSVSYSLLGNWRLAEAGARDYGAMRFTLSAGYKIGFFDRKRGRPAGCTNPDGQAGLAAGDTNPSAGPAAPANPSEQDAAIR